MLKHFLKNILAWMHGNKLKQNADKTKVVLLTSERTADLFNGISVAVGDSRIRPSSCVRNLGAWLYYSRMDMEWHVNSVCKSCFGHIRRIGHIRKLNNGCNQIPREFSCNIKIRL